MIPLQSNLAMEILDSFPQVSFYFFPLSQSIEVYLGQGQCDAIFLFSTVFLSTLALNQCKEIYSLHEVLLPKPMLIQFELVSSNVVFETSPGIFC